MRIGIDATCWWNQRGFGRYTRLLITAMLSTPRDHHFVLFVDREPTQEMLRDRVEIVRIETSKTVTEAAVSDGRRSIRDLLRFREAVIRKRVDVMYFPAVYSWFPTGGRTPSIITFHDAIAERFTKLVFPSLRGRMFWRLKLWLAKTTAAHITTVTKSARDEIVEHLGIPEDRMTVITEAPDPIFRPVVDAKRRADVRKRLKIPATARLILYLGGFAPHKNLLGLVDAFASLKPTPENSDVVLVFAGDPKGAGFHSHLEEIKARIAMHAGLASRVIFTGYVSDEDLTVLYSDCTAVAMPAYSEGFGLPAAEAMACGTPVVATRGGAVAEFVKDAGLFFDPLDVNEIAATLDAIVQPGVSESYRPQCLQRAAELSWDRSAAQMLDLLESYRGVG